MVFYMDFYGMLIYFVSGVIFGVLCLWSGSLWFGVFFYVLNNVVGVMEFMGGGLVWEFFGLVSGGVVGVGVVVFVVVFSRSFRG